MGSIARSSASAWRRGARRVITGRERDRALTTDCRGAIAVETALLFAFLLMPLFLGGADVAMLMKTEVALQAAVRNALFFAYSNSANAFDAAGVVNAAELGYGSGGPAVTIAPPTYAYYCITPTGTAATGTAAASADATCPAGQTVATWLSVSASADVALPVSISPFPSSVPMRAGATVRVN